MQRAKECDKHLSAAQHAYLRRTYLSVALLKYLPPALGQAYAKY